MTQTKLVKLRFKPGQRQAWLDWSEELKSRRDEVLATLQNEGVVSEACFMSDDGESVFYFLEAEDLEKPRPQSARTLTRLTMTTEMHGTQV